MKLSVVGASLLLITVNSAFGHHSFEAEFDRDKPVSVTGAVSKVEWSNPHIWYYIDVKDEHGKVTTWGFSGGPPGMLLRRGITKETLKKGDVISVQGFRAKDGSNNGSGNSVRFTDGRQVFTGAAEAAVPTGDNDTTNRQRRDASKN
jgi:hypothetical protein